MLSMDETLEVTEIIAKAIATADQAGLVTQSGRALTIVASLLDKGWDISRLDPGPVEAAPGSEEDLSEQELARKLLSPGEQKLLGYGPDATVLMFRRRP